MMTQQRGLLGFINNRLASLKLAMKPKNNGPLEFHQTKVLLREGIVAYLSRSEQKFH